MSTTRYIAVSDMDARPEWYKKTAAEALERGRAALFNQMSGKHVGARYNVPPPSRVALVECRILGYLERNDVTYTPVIETPADTGLQPLSDKTSAITMLKALESQECDFYHRARLAKARAVLEGENP